MPRTTIPNRRPGFGRFLLTATTALSPALVLGAAVLAATPAHAQTAQNVPTVRVASPDQKRKPKHRSANSSQPSRAQPASAPAPKPDRAPAPAPGATISGQQAFSASLRTSDSASLVSGLPGGAAWGAGGVSSLPAFNGFAADRNQVAINGMLVSPACPNQMNPPLSFVNPAMISSMKAYIGVAPVSVGGDYTGARVDVTTAPPAFSPGTDFVTSVLVSGFYRSNSNAYGVDATATMANRDTSVTYTGGWVHAGDYKAADGSTVKSTLYESQNHALSISKESFGNLFTVQVGGQFIPYQGYVNQYMDMTYNRGMYVNGRYEGQFDWGKFEASAYYHEIRHTMGFLEPDKTGDMPMDTKGTDAGYSLKATVVASPHDLVRIGNEFYANHLDDWWGPISGSMMMGPNTFININGGQRDRLGTFVEWERHWTREWTTIVGLRADVVWMNTGNVQGYNAMMYGADAAVFNALGHAKTDVNLDGSALTRYEPDAGSSFELGYSHKTRSPSLYERYAWSTSAMAMSMIGWFGDGNGYVGNLDLKPEKANTVSFTAGWHDPAQKVWDLKITPYYSYVQDYIDVDRCFTTAASSTCGLANLTAQSGFVNLRFANHDAQLYGVNLVSQLALWDNTQSGRGVFRATLNYVRGERTDGVDLYHMMPINGKLALDHTLDHWTNSIELQLVGAKDDVSQVHNELTTPAYALVNLRTGYQWQNARFDFGIDNLLNKYYYLPLGGADLVDHTMVSMMGSSPMYGFNVAGPGRSYNTRLSLQF
ncbi:MAG: TonB-dependent receptor plug domain-containing protein [Xanthobacteraceae bacterium]|nr:TonB-dependent receptor plug domain-containing protein [Xanthobacteraceae bacterium]